MDGHGQRHGDRLLGGVDGGRSGGVSLRSGGVGGRWSVVAVVAVTVLLVDLRLDGQLVFVFVVAIVGAGRGGGGGVATFGLFFAAVLVLIVDASRLWPVVVELFVALLAQIALDGFDDGVPVLGGRLFGFDLFDGSGRGGG
jgi:hypothetical protein